MLDYGDELDDPDYKRDDDSECSTDEKFLFYDDNDVESDVDVELEKNREKKRMLRERKIDPLKDGNLIEMYIKQWCTKYDSRVFG